MEPTFDPFLHASRCHVWHNTRWHQLLHHGGHLSVGDSLWMCRLCLHPFPSPPKAEKAAGRPTGRRHQQPEGVRQPNQERGPSCPPPAAGCPARAASSPCSRLTLLWGDWTDPAAFPSPLTLLTSTKACPCSQTGHFKPGQGEIEPLQLHRQPRTGGLTLELLDVWGLFFLYSILFCVLRNLLPIGASLQILPLYHSCGYENGKTLWPLCAQGPIDTCLRGKGRGPQS